MRSAHSGNTVPLIASFALFGVSAVPAPRRLSHARIRLPAPNTPESREPLPSVVSPAQRRRRRHHPGHVFSATGWCDRVRLGKAGDAACTPSYGPDVPRSAPTARPGPRSALHGTPGRRRNRKRFPVSRPPRSPNPADNGIALADGAEAGGRGRLPGAARARAGGAGALGIMHLECSNGAITDGAAGGMAVARLPVQLSLFDASAMRTTARGGGIMGDVTAAEGGETGNRFR